MADTLSKEALLELATDLSIHRPGSRERAIETLRSLAAKPSDEGVADKIIGEIEKRFPGWKSYRDLVDCIDCTLHALRREP
jgi:hypothetical protein